MILFHKRDWKSKPNPKICNFVILYQPNRYSSFGRLFSKLYSIYISKCGFVWLFWVNLFVFLTVKHIPGGVNFYLQDRVWILEQAYALWDYFYLELPPYQIAYLWALFLHSKIPWRLTYMLLLHCLSPSFLNPLQPGRNLYSTLQANGSGLITNNNLYFAKLMSVLSVHLTRPIG